MFPFISYPGFSSFLLALLFLCKSEFEHYFVYCIVRYSYFASCINCFFLIQRIQSKHFIFLLDDFLPFFRNILPWSPRPTPIAGISPVDLYIAWICLKLLGVMPRALAAD